MGAGPVASFGAGRRERSRDGGMAAGQAGPVGLGAGATGGEQVGPQVNVP